MRWQATLEYLVSRGVERTALVISANGRLKPLASNNDEIGRQLNRRVEFSFNGIVNSFQTGATTYLLQSSCTIDKLSKETGFSIEDLMLWNGFSAGTIEKFSPIRLKNTEKEYNSILLHKIDLQTALFDY